MKNCLKIIFIIAISAIPVISWADENCDASPGEKKPAAMREKREQYKPRRPDYSSAPFQNYNTYNYNSGSGEASRYRTDQGWSRNSGYYWYGRSNDLGTTGYTAPPSRSR